MIAAIDVLLSCIQQHVVVKLSNILVRSKSFNLETLLWLQFKQLSLWASCSGFLFWTGPLEYLLVRIMMRNTRKKSSRIIYWKSCVGCRGNKVVNKHQRKQALMKIKREMLKWAGCRYFWQILRAVRELWETALPAWTEHGINCVLTVFELCLSLVSIIRVLHAFETCLERVWF